MPSWNAGVPALHEHVYPAVEAVFIRQHDLLAMVRAELLKESASNRATIHVRKAGLRGEEHGFVLDLILSELGKRAAQLTLTVEMVHQAVSL